jgi:predicted aspartyl protease
METTTVGKVLVSAKIENLADLFDVEKRRLKADKVRSVQVDDALVDCGATLLSLPKRYIKKLGLRRIRTRTAKTAAGKCEFDIYNPVRLTVQGRDCRVDVAEVPDNCPVLIGQLPLEMLDWVVDPINQRLIGNPEHGGEQMIELYSVFE